MSLRYFPLKWEGTGDDWWYVSPIDCAAANGHFDLVRELLKIDNNLLFKLTSLRRIRRLDHVWDDDEEQFKDVLKHRSEVAKKLVLECESKKGKNKNSLIRSGYGGWLMYTAASAGDLCFVQEILEKNPLLVFGEGEYTVTDIFYAACRGKNCEVFRLVFDFAVSPRFELEEHVEDVSSVYKWEMTNRAVHAASRGGNVEILDMFLANCSDVLAYRDAQGSTVLHSAAGTGQVEVVKHLTSSFDIVNATDHKGNTALHVASYRGQLSVVKTLVSSSSSLIPLRNNAGETFLHKAVSGFQSPTFRRLDRQVELLNKLLSNENFHIEEIINVKNNDGRTALHLATMGNIKIPTDIFKLLVSIPSINLNVSDVDNMTPLDYLSRNSNSVSSRVLIRKLISAGGMFHHEVCNARKAAPTSYSSHMKKNSICISPGTSFRISDTKIFLNTGIENLDASSTSDQVSAGMSSTSSENRPSTSSKGLNVINNAAEGLKRVIPRPRGKDKKLMTDDSVVITSKKSDFSDEPPTTLRQRFLRHPSLPSNKRSLCVGSYQSSPNANNRISPGHVNHGDIKSSPQGNISGRSHSSSISKSSVSSPKSTEKKQKGIICISSDDVVETSCSSHLHDRKRDSVSKKITGRYFCFGEPSLDVKSTINRQQENVS